MICPRRELRPPMTALWNSEGATTSTVMEDAYRQSLPQAKK